MPQRKIKRVSDEHTRDRVRDNQRRHRARRRDYIATLEGKLEEAERTISRLKEHIKELEGGNSALDMTLPKENMDSTVASAIDAMNLEIVASSATENYDLAEPGLGNLLASNMSPSIASPTLTPASIFTYPTPDFSSETTTYEGNTYLLPSLQVPTLTPALLTTNSPCQESTILCSEAYILIAHQNHKHLSESTIAAFLWPSFRASTSPNEGCRVATSTLYVLLEFISSPPNNHQQLF
ncbi:Trappc4 protein [Fusarium flagelliforme]|uniref:Trappc4 protein n=1 Tax=Fusarium flagelliforme TaxID=2675880 RepID=UPI001E8D0278|nr:Trappc4 protein [Fusarium flagelliforme]KAH7182432.1 Trappc4 protein [Fusarium flagelliforme]